MEVIGGGVVALVAGSVVVGVLVVEGGVTARVFSADTADAALSSGLSKSHLASTTIEEAPVSGVTGIVVVNPPSDSSAGPTTCV